MFRFFNFANLLAAIFGNPKDAYSIESLRNMGYKVPKKRRIPPSDISPPLLGKSKAKRVKHRHPKSKNRY